MTTNEDITGELSYFQPHVLILRTRKCHHFQGYLQTVHRLRHVGIQTRTITFAYSICWIVYRIRYVEPKHPLSWRFLLFSIREALGD
jgi:hypothetical protein